MASFLNPPLVLTVLEVRYPELSDGLLHKSRQQLKKALRDRFPLMETAVEQQVVLPVGSSGNLSAQQRTFPRFSTRDRKTAVLVNNNALVVETKDYRGWESSFSLIIADVLAAVEQTCRPDGVLRVGLRYVDEIRVPGVDTIPGDWSGYIAEQLLAVPGSGFIPSGLQPSAWQGLAQYQTDNDLMLIVRYGPLEGHAVVAPGSVAPGSASLQVSEASGPFFMLDSDSFWQAEETVPEFSAGWIHERCQQLHEPVSEFFKAVVTDKLCREVFNQKQQ